MSAAAVAAPPPPPALAAIDRAYYAQDAGLLERVLAGPGLEAAGHPRLDTYARAYGLYRLGCLRRRGDPAMARELEAAAALVRRPPRGPWEVEYRALAAGIAATLAGTGGYNGLKYGPQAERDCEAALKLDPGNPRALFFAGLSQGNTPEVFGGDLDQGIRLLQQAAEAFRRRGGADGLPRWGEPDVYAWLGIFHWRKGERDAAARAYAEALRLRPDFAWVRTGLLPRLGHPR